MPHAPKEDFQKKSTFLVFSKKGVTGFKKSLNFELFEIRGVKGVKK